MSSIFCASLSSVSSALNSMSACIWRDYLMRIDYFRKFNDTKSSNTTKIVVLICGAVCTAFSFLISQLGSNLIQISSTINGALQAPIIGIFILSCMFPFSNLIGLYTGAIGGFLIGLLISIGQFITKPQYPKLPVSTANCPKPEEMFTSTLSSNLFYDFKSSNEAYNLEGFDKVFSISYMWLSPIGVLTVVILGVLTSLVSNKLLKTNKKVDDSLILYRSLFNKNK